MAPTKPLRELLAAWKCFDGAEYKLACVLGSLPGDGHFGPKWVFWSNNQHGNALRDLLMKMVGVGMLEHNEDELKFRWNPNFPCENTTNVPSVLLAERNSRIIEADLAPPAHQQATLNMVDAYSRDAMGDSKPLAANWARRLQRLKQP